MLQKMPHFQVLSYSHSYYILKYIYRHAHSEVALVGVSYVVVNQHLHCLLKNMNLSRPKGPHLYICIYVHTVYGYINKPHILHIVNQVSHFFSPFSYSYFYLLLHGLAVTQSCIHFETKPQESFVPRQKWNTIENPYLLLTVSLKIACRCAESMNVHLEDIFQIISGLEAGWEAAMQRAGGQADNEGEVR